MILKISRGAMRTPTTAILATSCSTPGEHGFLALMELQGLGDNLLTTKCVEGALTIS